MAIKLGIPDVDGMLRRMSWRQFQEWMAYAEIDPFDEQRADLRAAQIVVTMLNLVQNKKHYKLSDVVLEFGKVSAGVTQTPEQQIAIARAWASLSEKDEKN